ncbi:hypothetical protein [uncultured Bilophila sp.]|uniref:hypothetical protein n=1 Tax=uncultured Bilophila sp. TaxID=529385 RepID=UPI0026DB36BC|nr:hypothetical protein [uncultured Bilophila sp.]
MSTSTQYTLLPITRTSTTPRAHADVTLGFSKNGNLSIIFSPAFLAEQEALSVGSKVLVAYSAEAKKLLIAPASADQKEHLRVIRPRPGYEGAGCVVVSAQNLPEAMPRPEKQREPVLWEPEENGAVALDLSRFA